ncbi:DUF29 domain-containing protein [Salmonella enterica]|uniref:DUF29 domain-containing protein n=1 Tax=Salmonella enterica TaxID=28901 RepID=A0A7U7L9H8_SALER|nr:DUF29 domain-containing protein [Salmonella enterica]EBV2375106.1 DUF29 domain-containing protein [Salmonella enterica subsp. enterica serovar Enteritidis]EDW4374218.1 DUF29 domain-containing protein [Salmonella enterica subsp. diarizonae]EDW8071826.1 DUF29 domain-containing protein [Salmonella enterica subsp. arizonae serovar 48:z4,z24:-]EHX6047859.1 DUF29 domain-containing protein [Salmonella enterica subsp. enterica serovar Agama]EIE2751398.1 DUF29 domain-containing protein [Salmonella e
MRTRYETDFYGWTQEQARLLRSGQLSELDTQNLLEEIEAMGRSELRELVNRLKVLLIHLLKWKHQPGFRGRSWLLTIEEQRNQVEDVIRDNPGLKPKLPKALQDAYRNAIVGAERETGLPRGTFPVTCPWTFEQIINPDFYPD